MALSPINFLRLLLLVCIIGWLTVRFAARIISLLLGHIIGISICFRISGWSLREVTIHLKKGALEFISISEIRVTIRRSLVKLGFMSRYPKLHLLVRDLEITSRHSKKKAVKSTKRPSSLSGGKWMVLTYLSRFMSFSVTDITVKMPKAIIDVKNLVVDLSGTSGSSPNLNVKLHIVPLLIHFPDMKVGNQLEYSLHSPVDSLDAEKCSVSFICHDLLVECEISHNREIGNGIRNLNITSGDIMVNLKEEFFSQKTVKSPSADISGALASERTSLRKFSSVVSLKKHILLLPEKVSLNLLKLDLRVMQQSQGLIIENNVTGVYLKSSKSRICDDMGEAIARYDIQMDLNEIHLLREGFSSFLEVMKVSIFTSIYVPKQLANPVKAEMDIKLGGAHCNLILSRLMPLLHLQQSKKKTKILREQENNCLEDIPPATKSKTIMWTFTASSPVLEVLIHDINGLALYQGCSRSSHLYANNISSDGTQVHAEFDELDLYVADEHLASFKENVFRVGASSGSLMHIEQFNLNSDQRETEAHPVKRCCLVSSVNITGISLCLDFQKVESVVTNIMLYKSFLWKLSTGKNEKSNKVVHSSKTVATVAHIFKLNLGQCSVVFLGNVGLDDAVVPDPKRVNFGSQGGEVIISVSADGTSRQARITSTVSNDIKCLKNSIALDIFHTSLCVNKEKKSIRLEIKRSKSVYKEFSKQLCPVDSMTLFEIENAKFVRRLGGIIENSTCSLFSATEISARWEPDMHLALYEIMIFFKCIYNLKVKGTNNEVSGDWSEKDLRGENESTVDHLQHDRQQKRKDSVFAVDIEMLRVSAELADGVEASIQVQSIFSENAQIGILLEGLSLSLNEATVCKSNRLQISHLPDSFSTNSIDAKAPVATRWDLIIRALDVHFCMAYRLPFRAMEDAVEDTLRGLKLISSAKANALSPANNSRTKKMKTGSSKLGSVRFNIQKLSVEIEEEPIQGWLDEHYQLMKNQVCDLAARLKMFDDLLSDESKDSGMEHNNLTEKNIRYGGVDIDIHDLSSVQKLREEIHRKAFRSYYLACQKLVHSGGSGACTSGLQAGFKPSTARSSLLSFSATELDITLNCIEGGDVGMIEFIKTLDAVSLDNDVPFSRLYGRNILLHIGSLVAQLRNYTHPIFSGGIGKCEGSVVIAQQATCFQPQMKQDVFIGRWRKVCMLRSASGTTPAMKFYSNLPIFFQKGEFSFGVGYEPVFADISYAFTVGLRKANLGIRSSHENMQNLFSQNPSRNGSAKLLESQTPKKERSLPWWDDVRYYIHGKISLCFSQTKWTILGTTDPYENANILRIVSGDMDFQQADGHVSVSAKDFKIFVSTLDSLLNNCNLKLPTCAAKPFLYSSSISLEVIINWECESGNPLNHYLHALPREGVPRNKVYDPFRSTSLSLRWNISLKPCFHPIVKHDLAVSMTGGEFPSTPIFVSLQKPESSSLKIPTINLGAHDLVWLLKCWNMLYIPPHKLRSFSRWPRFGIPRATRSGNLSLDKVMTEFFVHIDATPACIKHVTLENDNPANGLTFKMGKLKYELCFSRGKQQYTFDCTREPLDLVYHGIGLHLLQAHCNLDKGTVNQDRHLDNQTMMTCIQAVPSDRVGNGKNNSSGSCFNKHQDDGFLLCSDYLTIRKQAPKADPIRLSAWKDAGRKNHNMTYLRSTFENGSEYDHTRANLSDDDEHNAADNCQRVFVYGLKLLWTIPNRDAVWSWVGGISKAFEPPKPSPSRQYAQKKLFEERQKPFGSEVPDANSFNSSLPPSEGASSLTQHADFLVLGSHPSKPSSPRQYAQRKLLEETQKPYVSEVPEDNSFKSSPASSEGANSPTQHADLLCLGPHPPRPPPPCQFTQKKFLEESKKPYGFDSPEDNSFKLSPACLEGASSQKQHTNSLGLGSFPSKSPSDNMENLSSGTSVKNGLVDDEEGRHNFMVTVIQPQFNLHSEEAHGRFLLAAASGSILARSFHSVLHVGYEVIERALGANGPKVPDIEPEMTWTRAEFSVMLEQVQAHVAPTDVDPGAGVQWLPKVLPDSPKMTRTGALLERVFMPCQMFFRYTRHKGGVADMKMKPLKELTFNSPNITATMTSQQFQVMLDVLSNLLFARMPKPQKSTLSYPSEGEDTGDELDDEVPDGIEEVELARMDLEQKERERKLLLNDIRSLLNSVDSLDPSLSTEKDSDFWMITSTKFELVQGLKKELADIKKSRNMAVVGLKMALKKAAQVRLMEKEKTKNPSCAMRISLKINKIVWSMLADSRPFAEAEITNMIYEFDRDYKDIGIAQFTTTSFKVENLLPNGKSVVLLSSWNPPSEWGKNVMLRVDAKLGGSKAGTSPLDLLQVEIYPLKIHLTESMYRMMWDYFFPEEEQVSHRRQEVWKVSTITGTRRGRKSVPGAEVESSNQCVKEFEAPSRSSATTATPYTAVPSKSFSQTEAFQVPKIQNLKADSVCHSNPELHQVSFPNVSREENMADSVAAENLLHVNSLGVSSSKSDPLNSVVQLSHFTNEETSKSKSKDRKPEKSALLQREEKKVNKAQDEKRSRGRKMDFRNIKISQVELIVTYEGSMFAVNDLRLLMDAFHCVEFNGTWRRLFSRVKKHIIWGVLKSVTGMQINKFKGKSQSHKDAIVAGIPGIDGFSSDSDDGQPGKSDQLPALFKRTSDGAGDQFVTSIKGLFNSQLYRRKAFLMRARRGEPNSVVHPDLSESDVQSSLFTRQLTITKKLIRRHAKLRPKGKNNAGLPGETTLNQDDSACASPPSEDDH